MGDIKERVRERADWTQIAWLGTDDSKAMRMIVVRTLRQAGYSGHTVDEAGSGAEALKKIQEGVPDIVFSDWNMPEMNGMELLKQIQAGGYRLKFGFVTSEASDDVKKSAVEAGAQFFITKPFTPQSFEAALKGLL